MDVRFGYIKTHAHNVSKYANKFSKLKNLQKKQRKKLHTHVHVFGLSYISN